MTAKIAGVLLAGAACCGAAGATTLTFDDLDVGTTLSTQYAGAVFSANAFSGSGTSTSGAPWADNTDLTVVSATGDDVGTYTGSLASGNLLRTFSGYLNESGDASFTVSFTSAVTSVSLDFIGVDTPADTRLYVYDGSTLLTTLSGTEAGSFTLSYAASSITSIVVAPGSYADWVGVDNLSYTISAVPEASPAAMLVCGLGCMVLMRRRLGA